jgi:hypothetical protein
MQGIYGDAKGLYIQLLINFHMIPNGTQLCGADTGKSQGKEQEEHMMAPLLAECYLIFFAVK